MSQVNESERDALIRAYDHLWQRVCELEPRWKIEFPGEEGRRDYERMACGRVLDETDTDHIRFLFVVLEAILRSNGSICAQYWRMAPWQEERIAELLQVVGWCDGQFIDWVNKQVFAGKHRGRELWNWGLGQVTRRDANKIIVALEAETQLVQLGLAGKE